MRTPTPDQEAVLASKARIRVVRAAPGSGKTWLVAEAIRTELASLQHGQGGIAAISFTNVGGDEIRGALGRAMLHPHFVGTIDAFLFRYIVRPHVRAIDPQAKIPEIIPPDWQPAELWTSDVFGKRGINPYACVWIGRKSGEPVLAHVVRNRGVTILEPSEQDEVRQFKTKLLREHGRITHSDSARLASGILRHKTIGPKVRSEIARRFPLIVVDELQDTGVFLAESVHALLEDTAMRGLLVGDPDQAIYEFNGAAPEMFDTFLSLPDAELLELRTTLRCPVSTTSVAAYLRRSKGELSPAVGRTGTAFLVRYGEMVSDVGAIAAACRRAGPDAVVKVVARGNTTVDLLTGRSSSAVPSLWCAPAGTLHRAVRHFRAARSVSALAAARAVLERVALGGEAFTDEQLQALGTEVKSLKAAALELLFAAHALPVSGSALEWHHAARELIMDHATRFCANRGFDAPKPVPKPQKRAGHDIPVAQSITTYSSTAAFSGVPVLTVHGVKGETHDVTIFVTPPTSGKGGTRKCPTALWWPDDDADDEERRIAYVAITRTSGDLIVCVDEPAFRRLAASQSAFVSQFRALSVNEFLQQSAAGLVGLP